MAMNRGKHLVRHVRSNIPGYIALTLVLSLSPAVANHLNVQTSDLANGAVTRKKIDNDAVNGAKIAPLPKARLVGEAGQPDFSDGGQGDCLWRTDPSISPVSFFKDQLGFVHVDGLADTVSDSGGDGSCDPTDPGEVGDAIVFRLPQGYRPKHLMQFGNQFPELGAVVVVGRQSLGDGAIPAGSVIVFGSDGPPDAVLDGIEFRPDDGSPFPAGGASKATARLSKLISGR